MFFKISKAFSGEWPLSGILSSPSISSEAIKNIVLSLSRLITLDMNTVTIPSDLTSCCLRASCLQS